MSLDTVRGLGKSDADVKKNPDNPTEVPRVGIFRGIAVERYMRPIEADVPETLARVRPGLALAGVGLTLLAGWLLFQ